MQIIPARVELVITRGSTWGGLRGACKDAAGDPVDLSGCTFLCQARKGAGLPLIHTFSLSVDDELDHVFQFDEMSPAETLALPAGEWRYDVKPVDAGGKVWPPILQGRLQVIDSISQAS